MDDDDVLAYLHRRREQMAGELAHLDQAIEAMRAVALSGSTQSALLHVAANATHDPRPTRSAPMVAPPQREVHILRDLGIPKAAIQVLRDAGRPMTTREIMSALEAGGFKGGKNWYNSVFAALKRRADDGKVTRPASATWGLPDWAKKRAD